MSHATPQMRDFARRLIKHSLGNGNNANSLKQAAGFYACDTLRPHLSTLMGNTGFRALLLRALCLAIAERPWLRVVAVDSQGAFEELEEMKNHVTLREISEGGLIVLAQLLGLLVAFVGEDLVLQLVRDAWPDASPRELDFRKGKTE